MVFKFTAAYIYIYIYIHIHIYAYASLGVIELKPVSEYVPGPLDPDNTRPSLNITARSYSCTIWDKKTTHLIKNERRVSTWTIIRLLQFQWMNPDGYELISPNKNRMTNGKHNKTMYIFHLIYSTNGTNIIFYLPSGNTSYLMFSRRLKPHDDVIKWKHFPRYWPLVWGIHRSPVNSPHKCQWRGTLMFLWSTLE